MAAGLVIHDLLPSPACVLGMGGWEAKFGQDIGMTRVVSLSLGSLGPSLSTWPLHMNSLKDEIWTSYITAQGPRNAEVEATRTS